MDFFPHRGDPVLDTHFSKAGLIVKIGEFDFIFNFKLDENLYSPLLKFSSPPSHKKNIYIFTSKIDISKEVKDKDTFFNLTEKNIKIEGESIFIPKPPTIQGIKFGISRFITERSKNSFLIHAGSIINKRGNVNLFVGESGAGKSTICSFSKDKILNDDTIVITKGKNSFYAQSTFLGYFSKIECRKIENIFFIKKSMENRVEKIGLKEGLSLILRNVPENSNYNLILEMFTKHRFFRLNFNLKGRDFVRKL